MEPQISTTISIILKAAILCGTKATTTRFIYRSNIGVKIIIDFIIYGFAILGIIGASIPLLREQIWWLRAWTYPRIQMAYLNAVILAIFIYVIGIETGTNQIVAALLFAAILYCISDIIRLAPGMPKQSPSLEASESDGSIKLLIGNVLMDNQQSEGLLSSIHKYDPDIIFLVETDEKWRGYLSECESHYPHSYLLPKDNYNGMLFYSKFPIKHVEERYLVQDHIPSLTIDLEVKGAPVKFFGVHPRPPRPEDDTEDMDQELQIIAREAKACLHPVIVTGDLNDVGWSTTTKEFLRDSKLLDPRRGRGLYNTFHAKYPIVRWPLDHIFHSDHFGLIRMERLPKFGSDHFPIFVELGILKDS